MKKSENIPYFVKTFNKSTSQWIIRIVPTLGTAARLGKLFASAPELTLTSWGWDGSLQISKDVGIVPKSILQNYLENFKFGV